MKSDLGALPFGNLSLHYSPFRHTILNFNNLIGKIIQSQGKGGYCLGSKSIFAWLLKSFAGARVYSASQYMGL